MHTGTSRPPGYFLSSSFLSTCEGERRGNGKLGETVAHTVALSSIWKGEPLLSLGVEYTLNTARIRNCINHRLLVALFPSVS